MTHVGGYRFDQERHDLLQAGAISPSELLTAFSSPVAIPQVIDLRNQIPRRTQGREGSCQGHGQTFASEVVHFLKSRAFRRFSPDYAYYRAQARDGIRGDQGSTIAGGLYVATQLGALDESRMPYSDSYNPQSVPRDADSQAAPFKASARYALPKTYRDIVEWWARGLGATWWGIRWAIQEDRPGWVTRFRPGRGGHSIGIGGWGETGLPMQFDSDGLPQWLWGANSWTTDNRTIRLEGWCRWHRDAVEAALRDSYTVVAAISDMESLQPRDIDWNQSNPFVGKR